MNSLHFHQSVVKNYLLIKNFLSLFSAIYYQSKAIDDDERFNDQC